MLHVRAQALLATGDRTTAAAALDRAGELAAALPAGEPFDRLRAQLLNAAQRASSQSCSRSQATSRVLP